MRVRIKPNDIDVPAGDPFRHDALGRKECVEILTRLMGSVEGPAVFGIDADWGNGKTTFLRMLHQHLADDRVPVVTFNAWESDYVSDPFTAIATEVTHALAERVGEADTDTKARIDKWFEHAEAVIRARAPAILRALASAVPLAGKAVGEIAAGFVESEVDERVSWYRSARKPVEGFRSALADIARSVSANREHPLLVLMIDELDRCRPSYAVELLEVAKHLFSVDGVVFVIAVNRAELAHSVRALYGAEFDARGYLGRFFDVDFRLPDPDRSRFIEQTIEAVGIGGYLDRTPDRNGAAELSTLASTLGAFFGETAASLRTVARAIHHLGVVYAALADNRWVLGAITAALIVLRTVDRDLYYRFVNGRASDTEVVDGVVELFGESVRARLGPAFTEFEAWVIVSQQERDRRHGYAAGASADTTLMRRYKEWGEEAEAGDERSPAGEGARGKEVLEWVHSFRRDALLNNRGINFEATVQRIELLSPELGGRRSDG